MKAKDGCLQETDLLSGSARSRDLRRVAGIAVSLALQVLAVGCEGPQAEVSRVATGLRAEGVRTAQAPAPSPAGPLTLDRAIAEALAASPQLEQMAARAASAGEQARMAEAALYPHLILSNDYSRTDVPMYALMDVINQQRLQPGTNFNDLGEQTSFSTQLQAQWSLFDGQSYYNHEAAATQQVHAQASLAAARNQLVAAVVQVYYQWLQARTLIAVAQKALDSAQTNEQLGQARVDAGVSLESEVLRLRASRAEAEGQLLGAQVAAGRLQAALERLLARGLADSEIPSADLVTGAGQAVPADPNALVLQALAQRPEITAAAAVIAASTDRVCSARAAFMPSVVLHGQLEWDREDLSGGDTAWLAGVSVPWPLFEGGASAAKLRQAKANLRDMQAAGRQVALDIALEVHQAALAARQTHEQVAIAQRQLDFARQSHQDVRSQYLNQTATIEALLQSEVAWQKAEAGFASAAYEARVAQALLSRALGEFADGHGPSL